MLVHAAIGDAGELHGEFVGIRGVLEKQCDTWGELP